MYLTECGALESGELSCDYLNWLLQKEQAPWLKSSPESRAVYAVRLDKAEYGEDVVFTTPVCIS